MHFNTSAQAISLTIALYIVFQALSPLLLATSSDHFGRRPIFIGIFTLYALASLGLALNNSNYPALLVVRALQSLAASAVVSLSYGAVADFCLTERRRRMLGHLLVASNLGTCAGPIGGVGGWIAEASGAIGGLLEPFVSLVGLCWLRRCCFCLRLPGMWLVTGALRTGNGSDPSGLYFESMERIARGGPNSINAQRKRAFKTRSPLAVGKVLLCNEALLSTSIQSSYYAARCCIQASIPVTFKSSPESFTELQVGLA